MNAPHPHKRASDMYLCVLTLFHLYVPAHCSDELGIANTSLPTGLEPYLTRRGLHRCREQDGSEKPARPEDKTKIPKVAKHQSNNPFQDSIMLL